jgi:hypothetical protein
MAQKSLPRALQKTASDFSYSFCHGVFSSFWLPAEAAGMIDYFVRRQLKFLGWVLLKVSFEHSDSRNLFWVEVVKDAFRNAEQRTAD